MNDSLNEREFELVNIIGGKLESNQRNLSRQLNVSLGSTNILIRRLIAKGYIRVRQLNKRKVEYLLTPKGFTEKMQKSIKYTLNTVRRIAIIQKRLKDIFEALHAKGERNFYLLGESGLVPLIELVFSEHFSKDCVLRRVKEPFTAPSGGTVLVCEETIAKKGITDAGWVNLIEELAKTDGWVNTKVF